MDRRTFMITASAGAAAMTLPQVASAAALDYRPGLLKERLDAGDTVLLDFKASWCGTCRAQGRAIEALKKENAAYGERITFINVDWDTYGSSEMAKRLKIPRRSTLVVMKGDEELGRIVAETRKERIKSLMDTALNAASA
ncbi:thioredoxin family protein [Primorskyibacter sp. S187A]|uniref:thioredoxin family protein n=1 Tax=Primorskyibacter sp. S187A TaxID=3415130 RepID=UPI003C7D04AE